VYWFRVADNFLALSGEWVALRFGLTFPLRLYKAKRTLKNRSGREEYLPTGSEALYTWRNSTKIHIPAREACVTETSEHQVTQLLRAWSEGDEQALEKLMPLVYAELHRLARRYMAGERPGHTLQTSALVNEAYLRLVDVESVNWQNRAHFFGVSAQLMRRILVDFARSRRSLKRGGETLMVSLEEGLMVSPGVGADVVALDDALKTLAAMDPRRSRVVELRFFGGLSAEEAAEVLKVSAETVLHDWKLAKVWLLRELSTDRANEA
jgi:RNA polymerase sigma-70 factor (ECF subfamily)